MESKACLGGPHGIAEDAAADLVALGIGPWGVWTIEPPVTTVRGKNVPFSFRIAIAEVGGQSYELLAPLTGDSIYAEHLAEHGEGFHHTCILYSRRDALLAAKAELLGQGREIVQSGDLGEPGEFCYFDVPELGGILELLYVDGMPTPETTVG